MIRKHLLVKVLKIEFMEKLLLVILKILHEKLLLRLGKPLIQKY
jgi:hypothetical protein